MKKIFCFLFLFFPGMMFATEKVNITYLLMDYSTKELIIYENDKPVKHLSDFYNYNISNISLDETNKNCLLYTYTTEKKCSLIRLNYKTLEKEILFEFIKDDIDLYGVTKTRLYYSDYKDDDFILYEYDSITKQIRKLFYAPAELTPDGKYHELNTIIFLVATDEKIAFNMLRHSNTWETWIIDRKTWKTRQLEEESITMPISGEKVQVRSNWYTPEVYGNKMLFINRFMYEKDLFKKTDNERLIINPDTSEKIILYTQKNISLYYTCTMISENYLIVPLIIRTIKDDSKDTVSNLVHVVQFKVFDLRTNKPVSDGIELQSDQKALIDAILTK